MRRIETPEISYSPHTPGAPSNPTSEKQTVQQPEGQGAEGKPQQSTTQREPSAKAQLEAQLHRMQKDFPPNVGDIPAAG